MPSCGKINFFGDYQPPIHGRVDGRQAGSPPLVILANFSWCLSAIFFVLHSAEIQLTYLKTKEITINPYMKMTVTRSGPVGENWELRLFTLRSQTFLIKVTQVGT